MPVFKWLCCAPGSIFELPVANKAMEALPQGHRISDWGLTRRSRVGGNLDPEAAPLPLDEG